MPTLTLTPVSPDAQPVTLTYEGVTESHTGPAAMVLKMIIAQAKGDTEALKQVVTDKTMEMARAQSMGSHVELKIGNVTVDGDTATVQADVKSDGQGQELPIIVVKQEGQWRVDMAATIEKLMGGLDLAAMMEEGMKQMAQGMSQAMEGMGEAMKGAFEGMSSGGGEPTGCAASDLQLAPYASEFRDFTNLDWAFTTHWPSFDSADERNGTTEDDRTTVFTSLNPPLMNAIKQLLDDDPSLLDQMTQLRGIHFLWTDSPKGPKELDIIGNLLWYTIGEDDAGEPLIWEKNDLEAALRPLLESMS